MLATVVVKRGSDTTQDGTAGLTRRALIGLGGGVVLTLSGGGVASALTGPSAAAAKRIWSRSTYVPLIGESFAVRGHRSPVKLVDIRDLRHRAAGSDCAFTLVFSALDGTVLSPDLPTLSHPAVGTFSMFLSPGARSGSSQPFYAVVDRTHG